jgi:ribose transport system permease protein
VSFVDAVKARRKDLRLEFTLGNIRDYAIVLATLAIFLTLTFSSDVFLTTRNLLNIGDQWAPVLFMALGGTVVVIAGGFDLSIGAIFAISGIAAVKIAESTSAEVGILAAILVGTGVGLANGFLVTVLRMNVFVATIGMSIVVAGLATVITEGSIVTTTAPHFDFLGSTEFLGVRLSIWIALAAIVLASMMLNRTALGRYVRAIGGNVEAARLSGIRTEWVRATTFGLSGLGGGLAGALVASRTASANANAFTGTQYDVWTALLLGGNSFVGGEGAIWRTVIGVLLLALIRNGFNLLEVDPLYQQVATGVILLSAVAIDMQVRRRRA